MERWIEIERETERESPGERCREIFQKNTELSNESTLKRTFRQYPAIHTNYSLLNCTISN